MNTEFNLDKDVFSPWELTFKTENVIFRGEKALIKIVRSDSKSVQIFDPETLLIFL